MMMLTHDGDDEDDDKNSKHAPPSRPTHEVVGRCAGAPQRLPRGAAGEPHARLTGRHTGLLPRLLEDRGGEDDKQWLAAIDSMS
jgi:hypothetical protein